jgi:hypothetical protein
MSYRLYNSGNVLVFVDTAHTIKNGGTQFWVQKLPKNKTWYSYDNTAAPILYSVYFDNPERDLIIDAQYGEFQDKDGNGFANDAALIAYLDKILGLVDKSYLAIAKGDVYGHSTVNKFGANASSTADTQEDIWDGGGTYSYPATALMTHISQLVDQSTLRGGTIEIQGLDANWALTVQTVDLDATLTTTAVALTTPLIRAFRMKVLENVVSVSAISLHNAGDTINYAQILNGHNQTLMALYTVPAGKTAFMTSLFFSNINATNKTPTSVEIKMWAADRDNGYEFQLKYADAMPINGDGKQHSFAPYYKFNQKTDIKITSEAADEDGHVHAGFDLILIDD